MKYMRLSVDFSLSMAVRMSSSETEESVFWMASSSGVKTQAASARSSSGIFSWAAGAVYSIRESSMEERISYGVISRGARESW